MRLSPVFYPILMFHRSLKKTLVVLVKLKNNARQSHYFCTKGIVKVFGLYHMLQTLSSTLHFRGYADISGNSLFRGATSDQTDEGRDDISAKSDGRSKGK